MMISNRYEKRGRPINRERINKRLRMPVCVMHVYYVFIDITIKYMLVFLLCNYYNFLLFGRQYRSSFVKERDYASFESFFRFDRRLWSTNVLVEIPINDRLIPADRRTRGGHNQAYKHLRANTTLGQNSFGIELSLIGILYRQLP